jgi:hypothetical protein
MAEMEARPPAQNRHGGAPRGERTGKRKVRATSRRTWIMKVRLSALRHPSVGGGARPRPGRKSRRGNKKCWSNKKGLERMGRRLTDKTRKQTETALGALEQRELADFLARSHATLSLWRWCSDKSCHRQRRCCGDVGECGTRCAKDRWAFVHHVVKSIAAGRTRRAAVRFAGQGNCKVLRIYCGFGAPIVWHLDEDGQRVNPDEVKARINFGTQFKRLTRCGAAWLRNVPRVAAKA